MARTIFESVFTNPGKPFRFVGRYSFLDFINTEANEAGGRVNLLTDDRDFVAWLVLAKMFERNKLKWHQKNGETENRRVHLEGCACAPYVNASNGRGDCRGPADSARQY